MGIPRCQKASVTKLLIDPAPALFKRGVFRDEGRNNSNKRQHQTDQQRKAALLPTTIRKRNIGNVLCGADHLPRYRQSRKKKHAADEYDFVSHRTYTSIFTILRITSIPQISIKITTPMIAMPRGDLRNIIIIGGSRK